MIECICKILAGGGGGLGRCNMMECICEILAGGGQVKSVDIKISFSREGVM